MKTYKLKVSNGEIEVQLTDDDAKRYGEFVTEVESKAAPAPQNKARGASTKEA